MRDFLRWLVAEKDGRMWLVVIVCNILASICDIALIILNAGA